MTEYRLADQLESALAELPIMDAHTHLCGSHLGARGLHDVLLYHMAISDLYGAGCPSGARLTEFPDWPDQNESHRRIAEALPFLPLVRNTGTAWMIRRLLNDLYGWKDPVTASNWRKLDDLIRERADDPAWHRQILDKAHIHRACAEFARRGDGAADDCLQYSLEWGMFMRCQWGEYDTALYDLERTWGRSTGSPAPIGAGERPPTDLTIHTLDDIHAALDHYVSAIPYDRLISTAMHLSTDIDYRLPSEDEVSAALKRRSWAGPVERDTYAAYIAEEFFKRLEAHGDEIVFQFSFAAEPLPFETGSRIYQKTITQLAEMVTRHPRLRFQCFLASRHANQSLCSLARELPNLSLAGFWWHNFFPQTIREVFAERLDMLPLNKHIGFFSDAYCVEWTYAKWALVRRQMAEIMAERVLEGEFSFDEAVSIIRTLVYETPETLLGMKESDQRNCHPSMPSQ